MNLQRLMRWPLVLALAAALLPWSDGAWREVGQAARADAGDEHREWEILMQKQHEQLPLVMEIERRLEEAGDDLLGGVRFEGARAVVQTTEHGRERAMDIVAPFAESGDIIVETVHYSQRELEEAYERLNQELSAFIMNLSHDTDSAEVPGINTMWMIDHRNNRIVLHTSDERIRARAAELVDPDMLVFRGPVRLLDQTAAADTAD